MKLAGFDETFVGDLWLGFCLGEDLIAGGDPPRTDELAHLREPRGLHSNAGPQFWDAAPAAVVDLVPTDEQLGKIPFQVRVVQLWVPLLAVSSDDQGASVSAHPQPDAAQPALDFVLFLAFAGVPYNQVEGASAEKELV